MPYQFAAGFNQAGSLSDLSTQPVSTPMRPGRLRAAGDRSKVADGDTIQEWVYSQLTHAQFTSLMSDMGLDADDFTPVFVNATVRTKKNDGRTFANYNAVVSFDQQIYDLNAIGPQPLTIRLQITGAAS